MLGTNNLDKLIKFIFEVRWEYDFPITLETKISKDLKIYGDDATEFMIAYGKRFNVNVSRFMVDEYFADEGMFTFFLDPPKKTLTINHLIKGIEIGRLDEEVMSQIRT